MHSIDRRTLHEPMHDEQLSCLNLTDRRRTAVRFLGQQSEMMIDDTCPQAGEMRSFWEGTTKCWTNEMRQDDTWEGNRHHSHIFPLFRSHLTRDTAAMFPFCRNPVVSTKHECRNLHLPSRMPRRKGDAWFWCCQKYTRECRGRRNKRGFGVAKMIQRVQHPRRLLRCHRISTTGSRRRDVVICRSDPERMAREREMRASCLEPSSTTRAKSRKPTSPHSR